MLGLTLCLSALSVAAATGQSASVSQSHDSAERGPLSIGVYGGELYKATYLDILYRPQDIDLSSSYIAALNIDYRLYRWHVLPIELTAEFNFDKHFGQAHEYEAVLTPLVRWVSFPWSRYLYTTVGVAALGVSYVTGVSPWERQNSGNDRGSNLLQFGAIEVSFAARASSPTELFVRVHHRSGIWGLINGVAGGSNYLSLGFRRYL
jgi:hypothetical protein